MMPGKRPIWFFVGLLLLFYGIVILTAGLWEIRYPPLRPPVLFRLHASIWWGALLGIFGAIFIRRNMRRQS